MSYFHLLATYSYYNLTKKKLPLLHHLTWRRMTSNFSLKAVNVTYNTKNRETNKRSERFFLTPVGTHELTRLGTKLLASARERQSVPTAAWSELWIMLPVINKHHKKEYRVKNKFWKHPRQTKIFPPLTPPFNQQRTFHQYLVTVRNLLSSFCAYPTGTEKPEHDVKEISRCFCQ